MRQTNSKGGSTTVKDGKNIQKINSIASLSININRLRKGKDYNICLNAKIKIIGASLIRETATALIIKNK